MLLSRARGLSCLGHTHKAAAHALGDIGVQLYVGPSQRGTGGGVKDLEPRPTPSVQTSLGPGSSVGLRPSKKQA